MAAPIHPNRNPKPDAVRRKIARALKAYHARARAGIALLQQQARS